MIPTKYNITVNTKTYYGSVTIKYEFLLTIIAHLIPFIKDSESNDLTYYSTYMKLHQSIKLFS